MATVNNKSPENDHFYRSACIFEAALIFVAILLGWCFAINPFADLYFAESAIGFGILATLPLILLLVACQLMPYKSLQGIRQLLMEHLIGKLYRLHWTDLLVLAAIAGIGEEVLFRGFLQPWLEGGLGLQPALWVSSVVFGLLHAVTPLYALLAGLMSLYLGLSLDFGHARNLLTPIVIHGLYDFAAFLIIIRDYKINYLK